MTKKWQPKEFRPEYERVVGYSFLGLSNEDIASKTGFGKQHVSNILNLPEAKALMMILSERQREKMEKTIPEALEEINKKAIERVHALVHNDELFEKSPFAVVDRSLAVLKGTGHIQDGVRGGNTQNNFFQLPSEQAATLLEGLTKAQEAKRLHKGRDVTELSEDEKKSA